MVGMAVFFILVVPSARCPRLEADVAEFDSGMKESNDALKGRTRDFIAKTHKRGCDYCAGSGRVSLFAKWFYPGKIGY